MLKKVALVLAAATFALAPLGCGTPDSGGHGQAPAPEESPADANGRLTPATLPSEPGYAWDIARYQGTDPIPVSMPAAGPWTLVAGADWPVSTTRIVDPAEVVGIDQFSGYDFVVEAEEFGVPVYYPRAMTDEWMLQLGKIEPGAQPAVTQYTDPLKLWPMNFAVGETFVVTEGGSFRIDATVVAQSTVTVPAGTIDEAYLLRFDYTPLTEGAIEGTNYYILAPNVGFVALFSVASGDEASGFTALDSAQVLVTLPEKR